VHHSAGLSRWTRNPALVKQLADDYTAAALTPRQRAMLDYAARLTREPWAMREPDVAALREVGFSDRDILDINQVAAYYAYVNRVADGLGVGVDEYVTREAG
jgi:uncharacterized peroxidase-related enzyme